MEPTKIITKENLETYTTIVKSKLNERISEPTTEGTENMVLRTDGKGNRYWSEIEEAQACTIEDIKEIVGSN